MQAPIWITAAGDLGIIPQEEYFEFFFDAYNPAGGNLTYSLISGSLPAGIEIRPNGTMAGIPVGKLGGVPSAVSKITTSEFTIRIKNSANLVADRTFFITVAGILPQTIVPNTVSLGTCLDGTFFYADINTIESNDLLVSTFSIINGELPPGVTLDPITGIISGYIIPTATAQTAENTGYDNSEFSELTFDFSGISISKNYQFTIKADNGVTIETQNYTINVIAIDSLTADSTLYTADNESIITADILSPFHRPVLMTDSGLLANVRQTNKVDIQIVGKDFDGDSLSYTLANGSLPTGLTLNSLSGWISGQVPLGSLGNQTFNFGVYAFKTENTEFRSNTVGYSIKVLGEISDTVIWNTPSDLGSISTGSISELSISAYTASERFLYYRLEDSIGQLPIGLSLTEQGLITGRVSFDHFMLDSGTTTFDNNETTFDRTYTFTVAAYDVGNFVFDTKTFTLRIAVNDSKPYENLFIQILSSREQRQIFEDILNNTDIFPENYIYRSSDPWFGKNISRRSLFLYGLEPDQISDYIAAMQLNHYWKTLNFGQIQTARAVDDNFDIKYEVVYIDLIDSGVNSQGLGPNLAVSLPENSANISTIYPNSFPNMAQRIIDGIGYENKGALPDWMTSRQEDGTVPGFKRVMILAYCLPGTSKEIAYRVKQVQARLQNIDFTIDRYEYDNSLSSVYNKSTGQYKSNNFVPASGTISGNINSNVIIGLTNTINGQGVINGYAGEQFIYGIGTSFGTQLTIGKPLFRNDTNAVIGTIISISSATLLKLDAPLTANLPANITYSSISTETNFVSELHVGDLLIIAGNTRIGTVKSIENDGNLTLYSNSLATFSNVTFQHTYRDSYTGPGDGDKYLKYPQVGVIS